MGLFDDLMNIRFRKEMEEEIKRRQHEKINKDLHDEILRQSKAQEQFYKQNYYGEFTHNNYTYNEPQQTHFPEWNLADGVTILERPEGLNVHNRVYIIKAKDSKTVIRINQKIVYEYVRLKTIKTPSIAYIGINITPDDILKCAGHGIKNLSKEIKDKESKYTKKELSLETRVLTKVIPPSYPEYDYESPCLSP